MNTRLLDDETGVDEDTARWLLRVFEQRVADTRRVVERMRERRQRAHERRLGEQMGAVTLAMHAGGGS